MEISLFFVVLFCIIFNSDDAVILIEFTYI